MKADEARKKTLEKVIELTDKEKFKAIDKGQLILVMTIPLPFSDEVVAHYKDLGYNVIIEQTTETDRKIQINWNIEK